MYSEMVNGGSKRGGSGEYNMDLKNSFSNLNSSMSVNLGSEGYGAKLVSEAMLQIESQRRELGEVREVIEGLEARVRAGV